MLDQQKQYIVNLANLGNAKVEFVGELAMFTRSQLEKGITLPVGFVITTIAFDDFLLANDLVDQIGPLINSIDYTNIDNVKKTSEIIKQAFAKATMPDLIKGPLKKAYSGLSGFSEVAINLKVSAINDDLRLSVKGGSDHFFGITGFDSLVEHVKEVWADFFSTNALLYRGKIGYEGFLTEAIVVQKLIHAEVSGKIYTINPTDNDPAVMEVQAFWGLDDGEILNEIVPDSYFIDKRTGDVIEKKVVSQDYMIVRKSKSDPSEPYLKVRISPVWQKRAKLDDRQLYLLFDYASRISQLKDKPQEISWCLESGRVYFLDNVDFEFDLDPSSVYPVKPSIMEKHLENDIKEAGRIVDMEDYVKEIEEDVIKIQEPQKEEIENIEVEPIQEEKMQEKEEVIYEEPKDTETEKDEIYEEAVSETIAKEVPQNEEKVVVDVKLLDKLEPILKGKGHLERERFGLAHFVFAPYDLEDLTGDEILILKTLNSENIPIINSVKGAVIETELPESSIETIRVPLIHGIKNAFEVLRDKEVITIDPATGKIYIGAGVRDVSELKLNKVGMVDEVAEKAKARIESKVPVVLYESEDNVPIKTTCDFWQYLDIKDLKVENRNAQGYYIKTSSLMDALGYEPLNMLGNPKLTQSFIEEAAALIKNIFEISNRNHLILESSTRRYKEEKGVMDRGLELLNIDMSLILYLRNKENFRNISLALADIGNEQELIEAKKEITAGGVRRSSSFKLMVVINTAYSAIGVKGLVQNSNIDGIIVDLDDLLSSLDLRTNKVDGNLANFLRYVFEIVNSNNTLSLLINREVEIGNEHIKLFLEHGLSHFITIAPKMVERKLQVSDMELLRITKQKKRGRKKKKIDFGF